MVAAVASSNGQPTREALVDEFLAWALAHSIAVVSTKAEDPKRPEGQGWEKRPPLAADREVESLRRTAIEHGRNLGVSAQGSHGVIVAEGDSPEDIAAVEALNLGEPVVIISGHESGERRHFYWATPADWPEGAPRWFKFEQGRVTNGSGFFVGPGSVHPDSGNLYVPEAGTLTPLQPLLPGASSRLLAAVTSSATGATPKGTTGEGKRDRVKRAMMKEAYAVAARGETPTVEDILAVGDVIAAKTAADREWIAELGGLAAWVVEKVSGESVAPDVIRAPGDPLPVARTALEHAFHGDRLAYIGGSFYTYRGTHWAEPEVKELRRRLYDFLEGKSYMSPEGLKRWQPTSPKVALVEDALAAVAWRESRPDVEHVAFENCLLDVKTRETLPHTPDIFNLYALPFEYDASPPTPAKWLAVLDQYWPEDPESIACLQEVFGYILAGGTSLQKIFMLVGPPRSGKGTIGRVLVALLGLLNVCSPTLSSFASAFGMANLVGKQLALIGDARIGDRNESHVAVERLLSISGEDAVSIPRKYRDDWNGTLPTRFLLLTNEVPRFRDASGALASRFVILTMERSFLGAENENLTTELLAEAPGIFAWALEGLDRLRERGHFLQPAPGRNAVQQMADMAAPVAAFVRDRCVLDREATTATDSLFESWDTWSDQEGSMSAGTKAVFIRDLVAAYPQVRPCRIGPKGAQTKAVAGIRLWGWEDE